jgi:hypothetical protein
MNTAARTLWNSVPRRRLRFSVAATVLVGLFASGWMSQPEPADALVRAYSFESLARRSTRVVTGTVEQLHSYRAPFVDVGEVIFTDVVIRVDSVLKGDKGDEYLFVQVLGGRIDDVVMRCPDSARYAKGERVLVFLRPYSGKLWNTGWYQGKYRLTEDGSAVEGQKGLPIEETIDLDALKLRLDRVVEPSSSEPPPSAGAGGEGAGS